MRLFVLGGVLLLAGLGVGFFPLQSAWLNCGSAFGGASGSDGTDIPIEGARISDRLGPDTCGDDRSNMRMAAIGLLVAAGVSAAGGWAVASAGNGRRRK
jgi:hypothetical protein